MNNGLVVPGRRGNLETLPKTDFFIGCVVSPFKRYERELMPSISSSSASSPPGRDG